MGSDAPTWIGLARDLSESLTGELTFHDAPSDGTTSADGVN
jgi:hypothetical protein